ncbi:MAG: HNH endonuclease [Proteobacteria bacterium]|nr:HNH endonuclease [Bacteroidota bacterium]MBU2619396.1 HNH endonuclease [Pseudomonadota bacterium]
MIFEDWLRHRGLSDSSVLKYEGALSGAMSQWAIESGLIEGPLTSIQSHSRFEAIAKSLRNLPIYLERNERGHNMYNSALNKYSEYLAEGFDNDVESDIDKILSQSNATETETSTLLKTRIGQGSFRQKLIAYWKGCAVTGYKDCSLLVASHIKPWRASANSERLNYFNGLLLLPNLDRAFDSGLITFGESGTIILSPLLEYPDLLGVSEDMKVFLDDRHQPFMHFHRNEVFRAT